MANVCTEVGASLQRGQLDAMEAPQAAVPPAPPPRRASRDVPVQVFAKPPPQGQIKAPRVSDGAPASAPAPGDPSVAPSSQRAQHSQRPSTGGEDDDKLRNSADELLRYAEGKHSRFMDNLEDRISKMDLVQGFWERGHLVGCLHAVRRAGDVILANDVLRLLSEGHRPTNFKLDMCVPIAPIIFACLRSNCAPVVTTALSMLLLLLNGFSGQIKEAARSKEPSQREISGMERRQRLHDARDAFVSLLPPLQDILKRDYPSNVLTRARSAQGFLQDLENL